ncbi:MAG TPA: hypothetical protein VGR08_14645 [Thermomicrobiales bacterium]|nr:hypothetical protein [Thermomicrobiales bacterium]
MRNVSPDFMRQWDMPDVELIGRIVLLQVQVRSLKRGERPRRWYDPDPLTAVPGIRIDPGGVTGIDGDGEPTIGDVHHRDHPDSRFRGENGVSIGFTSHYRRMRDRFGDHLQTGIAGENIIVETDGIQEEGDLAPGMVISSGQGLVRLGAVECVKPCAEFTKWCLRYPHDQLPDAAVTDALKFLFSGTRGFLATIETTPQHEERDARQWPRIAVGDLVYRRRVTA